MTDRPDDLVITFDRGAPRMSGVWTDRAGNTGRFEGWLELLAAVENAWHDSGAWPPPGR